ncbi:glycosyltransferase family 1 protein [Arthrobacter sp. TS-15]|uniref:glycosyltransferase family 4 protein n=1 Tax=Arthrobacter sp. TS-15 TaxID=2510797 RepID=UPI00115E65C3|nr:glycosyltransferase family 4 protein [Arthrobacter sp. TS-15]TQS92791.1 glycosyltransferase family 1 protein [Arthrobacter sp. TS-15]
MSEQSEVTAERLRICLITNELPGVTPYTGGIGVRFLATAEALVRLGHEVTVLVHRPSKSRNTSLEVRIIHGVRIEIRSVRLLRMCGMPTPLANALGFGSVLGRGTKYDIVFAPEWGGWASLYSVFRSKEGGHLVTSLATSLEQAEAASGTPKSRSVSASLQRMLERVQTTRSDYIVAVSSAILRWTKEIWPVDEVPAVVVPNGLDKSVIDELRGRASDSDGNRAVRVLYTGRLSTWKGVDILMDAAELLWSSGKKFDLSVVGKPETIRGVSSDAYIEEVSARHGRHVAVHGHLSRAQAIEQLMDADVAVFPSRFEAFGNAALEAKMAAKAVVVTSGSGFDDFCTNAEDCLMTEPGNAQALADALASLIDDEDLRLRLGREAEIRSRTLDINAVAKMLENVFSEASQMPKKIGNNFKQVPSADARRESVG